ncbi:MAG: helix-turn-helix domain-containing protein [Oscillospiraceae bacterium]|nr:helix-turn-helix domain-containing protein [Oscillospiraceae bacterium]
MISYRPFYETLYRKGLTEYQLINKLGFSSNTIHRIRKGMPMTTTTRDALCTALDCGVSDILRYEKEE